MIIRGTPKDMKYYYTATKEEKKAIVSKTGKKPRYMDEKFYYFKVDDLIDYLNLLGKVVKKSVKCK